MPATQARNQAVKPRDKKVSLPWSLQIFHFHHRNCRKNKPTNFLHKYELWQLRFLGKIVNPFHNNMQVQYPLLLKFCQRKTGKVYVQQGHTLDCKWSCSAVWSLMMLVNGKTPSCCFITRLRSHTFVLLTVPICSWQHDKNVLIH